VIDQLSDEDEDEDDTASAKGDPPSGLLTNHKLIQPTLLK